MKRITFLGLLVILVFTFSMAVLALAADEGVEISFCVGDDTLLINGEKVVVEKPYVVGTGVTLVPVRVITESFGAHVGWEDETQKVTLTYKDKIIVIYIGNDEAEINGEKVKMLAAPELTFSGFTMVPLRFISENFGAEVGYDEVTEAITVKKEPDVKVHDGMTYFEENNFFSIQVPDNYLFSENDSSDNKFVFVRKPPARYNLYTRDKMDIREFVSDTVEDIEECLENDRAIQKNLVDVKKFSVSSINKLNMNTMEVFYYDILDKEKNSIIARKTMFSIGEKTVYSLACACDSAESFTDNYRNDKLVSVSISYKNFTMSVPEVFSDGRTNIGGDLALRSETVPKIIVGFYKTLNEEDVRVFAENKYAQTVKSKNSKFVEASEIVDCEYGENKGVEFTVKYLSDNSVSRYIMFDCGGYIAFLELSYGKSENQDMIVLVAECFTAFANEESVEDLPFAVSNSEKTKVHIGDMIFELPDDFEFYTSDDEKYAFVYSNYNKLMLVVYGDTAVIDNEDVEYSTVLINTIPGWGGQWATRLDEKMDNCEILYDTVKMYEAKGWDIITRSKAVRINYGYSYDYSELSRWIAPQSVDIHQKICYYYVNVDGSERDNFSYREIGDPEKIPQQKLNTFVFTYTDISDVESVNAIIDEIMQSVKMASLAK